MQTNCKLKQFLNEIQRNAIVYIFFILSKIGLNIGSLDFYWMFNKSNLISAKDYKSNLISFYSEKERKMKYPVACIKVFQNECRQLPSAPLGKTFCETAIIVEVNLSNFYHISSVIKKGSFKRNRFFWLLHVLGIDYVYVNQASVHLRVI